MNKTSYIEMIQKLSKHKMWFTHTNDTTKKMGCWYQLEKIPSQCVIDYRTVLPTELVFECDLNWDSIRFSHNVLTTYLERKNIPYYLFDSGGKGYHQHVFCEYNLRKLKKYEKWFGEISIDFIRYELWKYIQRKAISYMACDNWMSPDPELDYGFDPACVRWSSDRKGHLVRVCGGRQFKKVCGYKTQIFKVPQTKQLLTDPKKVIYPKVIKKWKVPSYILQRLIEDYIKENHLLHKRLQKSKITPHNKHLPSSLQKVIDGYDLPIRLLFSKCLPEGSRESGFARALCSHHIFIYRTFLGLDMVIQEFCRVQGMGDIDQQAIMNSWANPSYADYQKHPYSHGMIFALLRDAGIVLNAKELRKWRMEEWKKYK